MFIAKLQYGKLSNKILNINEISQNLYIVYSPLNNLNVALNNYIKWVQFEDKFSRELSRYLKLRNERYNLEALKKKKKKMSSFFSSHF